MAQAARHGGGGLPQGPADRPAAVPGPAAAGGHSHGLAEPRLRRRRTQRLIVAVRHFTVTRTIRVAAGDFGNSGTVTIADGVTQSQ